MTTQQIINQILIDSKSNKAADDADVYCYISVKNQPINLELDKVNFNPPKTGDTPLSEESENVVFRTGLTATYKIGNLLIDISTKVNGTITYYVITPKGNTFSADYSWKGLLKSFGRIPICD